MIADALESFAGSVMVAAEHEHVGRLAHSGAVALGRDALGLRVVPQRAAERLRCLLAQLGVLVGPPHRIAQRGQLGLPRAGARGAGQVHAHGAGVLAGQRVTLGREIHVAGGLGGDRGAVVGGEHPAQETHGASIAG